MALRLNKIAAIIFLAVMAFTGQAQEDRERPSDKDYKDRQQFDKFTSRRKLVSAWQASQLREGALVVRLKTNKLLIDNLLKQGRRKLAEEKWLETYVINRNTMRAYIKHYNFSKLYFIYGSSSDSLLNGARSNIFLDTNLRIDPNIVMKDSFYLIAERDYSYNSTIGFVPQDSARLVREHGTAGKERAVVVKNKYGHQLKAPFPYYVKDGFKEQVDPFKAIEYVTITTAPPFVTLPKNKLLSLRLPKYYRYDRLSESINNFNENLFNYYKASPHFDQRSIDPEIKPFLY